MNGRSACREGRYIQQIIDSRTLSRGEEREGKFNDNNYNLIHGNFNSEYEIHNSYVAPNLELTYQLKSPIN